MYKIIPGSREREKEHQSAGSRSPHRLLAIMLVLAAVAVAAAGGAYYVSTTYTVRTVYVEGNLHYTQEEIQNIVMEGPLGNNSLWLSFKYRNKGVEHIPFVDAMDVKVLAPDTIKISVYEKALAGYVEYLDSNMYFDKDGYVVECSDVKTVGVPEVVGLKFDYMVLGEKLPVENQNIFNSIMSITKLLNKYELNADKIYFHSSQDITIYFGNVKAALGSASSMLEDKVMILPRLLPKLEGKNGTLRMENYSQDNSDVAFEPDAQ